MGSGDKHLLNFHIHGHSHGHGKKEVIRDVPKGCLAIMVGGEGEEQQRFVVPVLYFNHPLFMQLLKEAEEEYGFDQKGTITIPCHLEEFRHVKSMIDQETSHHHHLLGPRLMRSRTTFTDSGVIEPTHIQHHHHHQHRHQHQHQHQHQHLHVGCFRA